MSQTLDRGTLDRLIARGRQRGALTAADLAAALPIDGMDVDALVLLMLELDAAGISLDPEAFGPAVDRPVPAGFDLPPLEPATAPATVSAVGPSRPEKAPASPRSRGQSPNVSSPVEERGRVDRAVILAGLATFVLLGAALLLL